MKYFLAIVLISGNVVACASLAPAQDSKEPPKSKPTDTRKSTEESAPADSNAAHTEAAKQSDKVIRSEQEWRKLLTREEYKVLRMKGTERPFRNKYDKLFEPGKYVCAACGQELFSADTKFDSGCGWPAFYASMAGDRVILTPDTSLGMVRTEVTCARCGSHLGHIFNDAPRTPTGQRYCINSVSLKFIPADSKDASGTSDEQAAKKSPAGEKPSTPDKQVPPPDKSPKKSENESSSGVRAAGKM